MPKPSLYTPCKLLLVEAVHFDKEVATFVVFPHPNYYASNAVQRWPYLLEYISHMVYQYWEHCISNSYKDVITKCNITLLRFLTIYQKQPLYNKGQRNLTKLWQIFWWLHHIDWFVITSCFWQQVPLVLATCLWQ